MGKIFYDMGFLAQAKVEECSATDMIGQYIGHTGPKVQKLLEKAMGKVLFIDEAYRLADGGFATEAMDELVDCLTKPKFAQKLVVILAGYDKDMDRLISVNPGLSSRFPESVMFRHLSPEMCLELLIKILGDLKEKKEAPLDLSVFTPPPSDLELKLLTLFEQLSSLQSWGNARDVKSLARSMFGTLISQATPPVTKLLLTESIIIEAMETMLDERTRRSESAGSSRNPLQQLHKMPPPQHQKPPNVQAPTITTKASSLPPGTQTTQPKPPTQPAAPVKSAQDSERDAGVSDAIWQQLEADKRAATALARHQQRLQQEKAQEEQRIEDLKRAEQQAKDDEERRRREKERIEAELERRRKEELYAAMEREKEKERKAQAKIRELGICVAGYRWIKQGTVYRCAGGAHFVSDAQLGL
jgi:Ni/Co efflux regulator RcnB